MGELTTSGPARRVTIKDVARAAGVSPATVSNALNGTRRVDADTAERVDRAAAALGYVPNAAARRFRTGRANTIAVFSSMPAPVAAGPGRLGFLMEVAAAAAEAALHHGLALVLVPPVPNAAHLLRDTGIDGALLVEPYPQDPFLALLRQRQIPTVAIGDPGVAELPYVDLDYRRIAELLLEHLAASGAGRFPLLVGASARASHAAMVAAYRGHAVRTGMAAEVHRIDEAAGEEGAAAVAARLLQSTRPPDAVFAPVDAFAVGALRAAHSAGWRVPQDLRIVTRYDGPRARQAPVPLTAVDLKLDRVARLAIDRLILEIAGATAPVRIAAPPVTLVPRASSAR